MRPRIKAVGKVLAWTLAALVVIDVAVGATVRMPVSPLDPPSTLARYFDYGRSIQSKVDYLLGPDADHAAPIIQAGWIDLDCSHPPAPAPTGRLGVTVYGMSFTDQIASFLPTVDPHLNVTRYAGPSAPLSHSVACADAVAKRGRDPNPVRVVGVLASSLRRLVTLGGLTTSFEGPMPFGYPRYRVTDDGALIAEEPVVRTPADLRQPAKRAAYYAQIARHDAFYDPVQMDRGWSDSSVFLRLLRRARAQHDLREKQAEYVTATGAELKPDVQRTAAALLLKFARDARAEGATPIVLLLQDRDGAPDLLERSFADLLRRNDIAFVSSYRIARNDDPKNFVADGHFTPAVTRQLAERTAIIAEAAGQHR